MVKDEITHFSRFFDNLNLEPIFSKKYLKEKKKSKFLRKVEEAEKEILDKKYENFENLHKFEKKIKKTTLFRSGIGKEGNDKETVIIYCILENKLIFLRCLKHKEWINLLNKNIKVLEKEIESLK